jgi:hypothetical protein
LTNRQKLIQTNIYDLLFRLNQNILGLDNAENCIMSYIKDGRKSKKIECDKRCVLCISLWLDEEVEKC